MEQVLAVFFVVVTITTFIVIFLPTLEEAILKRLRLGKWAGMPGDSLLVFILIFPIWLPFWISTLYFRLVEWLVTEPDDDRAKPPRKATLLVWFAAIIVYLVFFLGPLSGFLRGIFLG